MPPSTSCSPTGRTAWSATSSRVPTTDFASFKQDNNGEPPPWTYSLYLSFEVPRNDAEMLVVDFDESIFTGGAHPNHDIATFNFMMPDAWQVYLPESLCRQAALWTGSARSPSPICRSSSAVRIR